MRAQPLAGVECDFQPMDGTLKIKLSKKCTSDWYYDQNTSTCRVEVTSGNTNILEFVPALYDIADQANSVIVSTTAIDPESYSQAQPPDATVTVVDVLNGTLLASGSARVTEHCPTEDD